MSSVCIVCEFNPLHNGHAYLISEARRMGADSVTCIMSGNAVQRGELAITDKYVRAQAAIACGADLVLELPYPWSSASADYFAKASISIAKYFGDTLLFGSECGDAQLLCRAADACESADFASELDERLTAGEGAAAAYTACLAKRGFEKISSNDILGIAYIRAIKRLRADMSVSTVRRLGASYNDENTVDGEFQSATAIRKAIGNGDMSALAGYLPVPMLDLLENEQKCGRLTDMRELESAILGFFRLTPPEQFEDIAEVGGGLANRICNVAAQSRTLDELFVNIGTKRYTDAKLRRALLFCMTGVSDSALHNLPEYSLLLAASPKGRELLVKNKKADGVNIVTKPADAPKDTLQYKLSAKLDALYGLARKEKLASDAFFKKNAYIEK